MNKMQMAHEMALELVKIKPSLSAWQIADRCFEYADAMQAEAEKRNKAEAEQKRKEVREILNDANTFIEREGQHFDDVEEWQPDWSQAPEWAKWWVKESAGSYWWLQKRPVKEKDFWLHKNRNSKSMFAPSFNYQGNWQDSLRKRPESIKSVDPKEYIDAVLQDIVDPCDHEWTHISKFGAEGDFYVCPCGAKSKYARGRK